MYSQCALEAEKQIEAAKRIAAANDQLRGILFGEVPQAVETHDGQLLAPMYPSPAQWKVFDHSAVVTRLYAVFERCVNDLVRQWLADLPAIIPRYSQLGSKFERQHRHGVAEVLRNLHQPRVSSLNVDELCFQYANATNGSEGYSILPEAFLMGSGTLNMGNLSALLTSILIPHTEQWIQSHPDMEKFVETVRDGQTTCDAELKDFIGYRNEAAHGHVMQTLGTSPLIDCATFITTLCRVVAEKFDSRRIDLLKEYRSLTPFAEVTEVYPQPNAVVAIVTASTTRVGDRIYVSHNTHCRSAEVVSIQDEGQAVNEITVQESKEVGFKFDWLPNGSSELFVI